MSVEVNLSNIPDALHSIFERNLVITPQLKKFNGKATKKDLKPVNFYILNEEKKTIKIPLHFAKKNGFAQRSTIPKIERLNPSIILRDYQKDFFEECLNIFSESGFLTLKAYAGFGKTLLCILLSSFSGRVTLVMCHRKILVPQWVKAFLKLFPDKENYIHVNGEKMKCKPEEVIFIVTMIRQYPSLHSDLKDRIGTMILDEAHCLATEGYAEFILLPEPKNIIVATATLERNDGMEKMMHVLAGRESVFVMNKSPYTLAKFETKLDFYPGTNSQGDGNFTELTSLLSKSEERNNMILRIIKLNPHKKFIVVCRLKAHCENLQILLSSNGIECDSLYGNKSNYNDSHVLIGNISKMGTGFDEENFCSNFKGKKSDVLILATSIKCNFNKKQFESTKDVSEFALYEQVRGRIMRATNPVIVYLVDNVGMVKNHYNGAKRLASYTNGKIIEYEYDEGSIDTFIIPDGSEEKKEGAFDFEDE